LSLSNPGGCGEYCKRNAQWYDASIVSRGSLPVVAAIPNYNMAQSLTELLPHVARQEYAAVFILDDASTDGSRDVVDDFDKSINFVAGSQNAGAGANRNRIVDALDYSAIIHFIDADMLPETERIPELAQELTSGDQIGFVGGLIRKSNGNQHPFNYGPRQCLQSGLAAKIQTYVCSIVESDPVRAKQLRGRYNRLLRDWPDPQVEPQPRQVFWSAEANLLIRSDVLAGIGGFDPNLREHEIQDLAIRLYKRGLERRFDPTLAALHRAVIVRSGNRHLHMTKAKLRIARKHGLLNWLLPNGSFRPAL
jgi:GT2 family glycosyltransferase